MLGLVYSCVGVRVVLLRSLYEKECTFHPLVSALLQQKKPSNEIGIARASERMFFFLAQQNRHRKRGGAHPIRLAKLLPMRNGLRSVPRSHTGGGGEAS
jgi:hypothetical protein